ncbi:MAG: FKBP-type peptidyl-prolyl cis-trans isomerase [Gulosibacter sp.]|uniref:FKBP-type peptidyl-prolyl cis-trans isomerase n=1 Tax=Gulosibacter sp. TaxID=2817531 RepID=UPI003F8E6784
MRSRSSLLVAGALSLALILSGCAGTDPESSTGPTPDIGASPSFEIIEDGEAISNAVISENFGDTPEVTLPAADLVGEQMERTIVVEGDGEPLTSESMVVMKQGVYDLGTGEGGEFMPIQGGVQLNNPQLPAYMAAMLADVPANSRIGVIVPAEVMLGSTTGAENVSPMLLVLDVQSIAAGDAADGEPQEATQDLVTVTGEPGAQPTIEVHSDQPEPTEQVIDVTIKGDGATVEAGDFVTVQYTGLLFSDGTEFDSSWTNGGTPISFETTGVVEGFANALVDQTVGSRITTVFPSELGYGDQDTGTIPPGSTLVFVVDIIATM